MDERRRFDRLAVKLVDKALPAGWPRPYSSVCPKGPWTQESETAGACIGGRRVRSPAVPSGVSLSRAGSDGALRPDAVRDARQPSDHPSMSPAGGVLAPLPGDVRPPRRRPVRGLAVDEAPGIGPRRRKLVDKPVSEPSRARLSFGLPEGAAGQLAMRPVLAPVPPRSLLWWWRQRQVTRSSFGRFAVSGT